MQPDYVRIQLKQTSERQAWKQCLPEQIAYWLYYQPSKLKVVMEEMGDFQGLSVELPWAVDEFSGCKEDWFRTYLAYLGSRYGVGESACFIDKEIQHRFQIQEETYEKYLKMLLLREAVNRILHKQCIPYRQAKLIIVDDGSRQAEYVIEDMAKDANYLTVITERPEALQNVVDLVFQEQGLAIALVSEKNITDMKADVVVNLISGREKITTRITGNCDLFDFGYTDQKALRLNQMNSKMNIFHTMKIKSAGAVISLSRLSQIFYYKDQSFQSFVYGNYNSDISMLFNQLWDSCFIEMVKVY